MTGIEIYRSFQAQLQYLDSHELAELTDRTHEDGFAREAGVEFVQAANAVHAERTVRDAFASAFMDGHGHA